MKGFFSELRLYICNHLINKVPSHTIRLWYYRKIMKFIIGEHSSILLGCSFDAAKGLYIGDNTVINNGCRLDTRGGIKIGNNVSISADTIILTADHDMDNNFKGRNKGVSIEDYVWTGTRSMVLPGVTLKKGVVIAAGAIVTKDVEENSVVGGLPAKLIRTRKPSFNYTLNYRRFLQ